MQMQTNPRSRSHERAAATRVQLRSGRAKQSAQTQSAQTQSAQTQSAQTQSAQTQSATRRPERTCVACRALGSSTNLVRMVLLPEGGVGFDLAGGAVGRGAWVHPTATCLLRAAKGSVRSLRGGTSPNGGLPTTDDLMLSLARAATRRAEGLIQAARRTRNLLVGGEACQRSFTQGNARLVVLAADALAAAKQAWISEATTQGLVVVWSTKAQLGALVGREELAVMVVTEDGLARNLLRMIEIMIPVTSRLAKANHDAASVVVAARTMGSQGRQDSEDG